jgi:hypothetical protein
MLKSIKKISLTATAVVLLMGNITAPEGSFYEDSSDFNLISSELESGWGWGFSKAHADCQDASSPDECYGVTYSPPDTYWDRDTQQDTIYDDTEGGDSGGGGNGGGNDGNQTTPEEQIKEECIIKANGDYTQCQNSANYLANTIFNSCRADAGILNIPLKLLNMDLDLGEMLLECQQEKDDQSFRGHSICNAKNTEALLQCS